MEKYDIHQNFSVKHIPSPSNSYVKKQTELTGFENFKYVDLDTNIFVIGTDTYKNKSILSDKYMGGREYLIYFLEN